MIGEILQYLNKWFVDTVESSTEYKIVADGIEGTFNETYLVGQYISVDGTKINDGVYKLSAVSTSKLTVDATLIAEETDNYICIWGLTIPTTLLTIATEITAYTSKDGLASESQGGRSVSYVNGGSWQDVYKNRLSKYKAIYSDKLKFRQYNIDNKRW